MYKQRSVVEKLSIRSRINLNVFFTPTGNIVIVLIGFFLRALQYLSNRNLWLDEVALASSFANRSYVELLKPLDYDQLAPLGFLWAEKFFVNLLGFNEFGLRYFPLLCGSIALIIFYNISRRSISKEATTFALILFSFNPALIYFSSECKPYMTDVLMALILLYEGVKIIQAKEFNWQDCLRLVFIGSLAIWFSFASVIVLAALALILFVKMLNQNKLNLRIYCLIPTIFWATTFVLMNKVIKHYSDNSLNSFYHQYWQEYFVKIIPSSLWEFQASVSTLLGTLKDPGGFYWIGLGAVLVISGFIYLLKENKTFAVFFISPIVLTLIASGLEKYPFAERLILFLVPIYLLFAAVSLDVLVKKLGNSWPAFVGVLMFFVFAYPIASSAYHLAKPRTREEVKPLINYLSQHLEENDIVFIEHYGYKSWQFYSKEFQFKKQQVLVGSSDENLKGVYQNLNMMLGKSRIWILFLNYKYFDNDFNEQAFLEGLMEVSGKKLLELDRPGLRYMFYENKAVGCKLYLYDFSSK